MLKEKPEGLFSMFLNVKQLLECIFYFPTAGMFPMLFVFKKKHLQGQYRGIWG